ncbi:MAG: VCBS repeat-containing protein [Myxococcota bacterium]
MGSVLLVSVGLVALIACNPPNPENEPPNIQLLDPVGTYDRLTTITTYPAAAEVSLDLTFRLRDRDGDSPLSIELYLDPTPANADDVGSDILLASAEGLETVRTEIPEIPDEPDGPTLMVDLVDVVLNVPDGLPEGQQTLVAVASDGTGIGDPRRATFLFEVNASISAPEISITPEGPTAQVALMGNLVAPSVDPEGGEPYHEWIWQRVDPADPPVVLPPDEPGSNFPGTLAAVQTSRGETWEFCVTAYESANGNPPPEGAVVQSRTTCEQVLIENAAPGAPGAVEVLPERATAADPLLCNVAVEATDPDSDLVTYQYDWAVGGTTVVTGATEPWLDPAEVAGGDVWTCTATALDESDGTALAGGSLTSPSITVAAASVGASVRASRTVNGAVGSQTGQYVGVAPLESFTAGFPQECLLVGIPTGVAGAGVVDVFRGSALQVNSPNLSIAGGTSTGFGGPIAIGDVESDGDNDAVVVGDGTVWVLYSDAYAPSTSDYEVTQATTAVVGISSSDTGFGAAVSVGDVFALSPNEEVVVSTMAAGVANTVRIIDGANLGRAASDIDLDVTAAASTITAPGTDDAFGTVVHVAPDLTGDGLGDLVVTSPGNATAVYVFPGGNGLAGAQTTAAASFTVTATGGLTGASATTGDIDGDGAADLIIGGPTRGTNGEVAVFLSGTVAAGGSLSFAAADYILVGGAGSRFGADLAVVPDPSGLFGDSLVVGAPLEDNGSTTGAGYVYVFTSDDIVGAAAPNAIPRTAASVAYFGSGVDAHLTVRSNPTDLDNDGYPDLVLSAPDYSPTAGDLSGRVYVLFSTTL